MQIQQSPSFDGRDTTVIVLRLYTTTEDFKSNNYNVTTTFIRIPPIFRLDVSLQHPREKKHL